MDLQLFKFRDCGCPALFKGIICPDINGIFSIGFYRIDEAIPTFENIASCQEVGKNQDKAGPPERLESR